MWLKWILSTCPRKSWRVSLVAANTSSTPSKSARKRLRLQMTSSPRSSTLCWRQTLPDCSPTFSILLASATQADSWLERMVTTSLIWWENQSMLAVYCVMWFSVVCVQVSMVTNFQRSYDGVELYFLILRGVALILTNPFILARLG